MSEQTASVIDAEVRKIVEIAYKRAHDKLTEHLDQLHTLAKALLEYETLSGDEIKAVLRGEAIIRDTGPDETDDRPHSSVPTGGDIDLGSIKPQGA